MKKLITLLCFAFVSSVSFAQTLQQPTSTKTVNQTVQPAKTVTQTAQPKKFDDPLFKPKQEFDDPLFQPKPTK